MSVLHTMTSKHRTSIASNNSRLYREARTQNCGNESPIHTVDYSRRLQSPETATICRRIRRQFRRQSPNLARQSPFSATVSEFGDCSRQCGQGLRPLTKARETRTRNLYKSTKNKKLARLTRFLAQVLWRQVLPRPPQSIDIGPGYYLDR